MAGFNDMAAESAVLGVARNGATMHLLTEGLGFEADFESLESVEVDQPGYERTSVIASDFETESDAIAEEVTVTNAKDLTFGIAQEDWDEEITAAAMSDGDYILRFDTDEPYQPDRGEQIELPENIMNFTLGATTDNE